MGLLDDELWAGKVFTGAWVDGHGGTRQVLEPASGQVIGEVGMASAADVVESAKRAQEAQRGWAEAPFPERAAVLRRAAELWIQNAPEVQGWLIRESGSVAGKAGFETHIAEQECLQAAALPGLAYGELIPSEEPRLSMVERTPVGVVGVIAPFNAPLILAIRSVAPALALGNAVILKPDPRTAVSGGVALARVLEDAGLPSGVFHVLPGGPDIGEALVTQPEVRLISFTGSTAAGRKVGQLAAQHLKRVHLELGGNSALVVLDDADLDLAVSAGAWGSFFHQGQICMASGRHLVQEEVYPEYVSRLASRADRIRVGNPSQEEVGMGPLIDERQLSRVHSLVTESLSAGARLAAGGTYQDLFYRPTVLAEVGPKMPAYSQEVFGPVAPVASFSSLEEAARMAADSPYGLSLGILTGDVLKGLELARRIPSGIVHINDQTISDEAVAPFGGVGDSGTGSRFGGAATNLEAFTDRRWITVRSSSPAYPL